MNYYAVLINKKEKYIESDAFDLIFEVYDESHTIVSDISTFKFICAITDSSHILTKKDANYSDGAATQISCTGSRVSVFINSEDTDDFDDIFTIELLMTHRTTARKQTLYYDTIIFLDRDSLLDSL